MASPFPEMIRVDMQQRFGDERGPTAFRALGFEASTLLRRGFTAFRLIFLVSSPLTDASRRAIHN